VWLDNAATLTDHHGGSKLVSPVGTLLSGISNPNLPRTYAFSVSIQAVPEPSTLGLALFGLSAAVVVAARRRRAR